MDVGECRWIASKSSGNMLKFTLLPLCAIEMSERLIDFCQTHNVDDAGLRIHSLGGRQNE